MKFAVIVVSLFLSFQSLAQETKDYSGPGIFTSFVDTISGEVFEGKPFGKNVTVRKDFFFHKYILAFTDEDYKKAVWELKFIRKRKDGGKVMKDHKDELMILYDHLEDDKRITIMMQKPVNGKAVFFELPNLEEAQN